MKKARSDSILKETKSIKWKQPGQMGGAILEDMSSTGLVLLLGHLCFVKALFQLTEQVM